MHFNYLVTCNDKYVNLVADDNSRKTNPTQLYIWHSLPSNSLQFHRKIGGIISNIIFCYFHEIIFINSCVPSSILFRIRVEREIKIIIEKKTASWAKVAHNMPPTTGILQVVMYVFLKAYPRSVFVLLG